MRRLEVRAHLRDPQLERLGARLVLAHLLARQLAHLHAERLQRLPRALQPQVELADPLELRVAVLDLAQPADALLHLVHQLVELLLVVVDLLRHRVDRCGLRVRLRALAPGGLGRVEALRGLLQRLHVPERPPWHPRRRAPAPGGGASGVGRSQPTHRHIITTIAPLSAWERAHKQHAQHKRHSVGNGRAQRACRLGCVWLGGAQRGGGSARRRRGARSGARREAGGRRRAGCSSRFGQLDSFELLGRPGDTSGGERGLPFACRRLQNRTSATASRAHTSVLISVSERAGGRSFA
jgi:hypothetical protein